MSSSRALPLTMSRPSPSGLDVERLLGERHGIADDLLDDVGQRDDALGAAVFIHDDGQPLRMIEEAAQQIDRLHRLRHEGRRERAAPCSARWDRAGNRARRARRGCRPASRHRPARGGSAGAQPRDEFLVGQIVGQREGIDARRHAILRRLVAELDDFLDHLALRLVQRALLGAQFHERFELLFAENMARSSAPPA